MAGNMSHILGGEDGAKHDPIFSAKAALKRERGNPSLPA
jgi:hypothetical protein